MIGHILDYRSALKFIPDQPTAIIRICETETIDHYDPDDGWDNSPKAPLIESPWWRVILTYRFGDLDPDRYRIYEGDEIADKYQGYPGGITPEIAKQMLHDFSKIPSEVTCYVFHCYAGVSRSPAVALAMNKIFKLELDWAPRARRLIDLLREKTFETQHPDDVVGNLTVYNTLIEAAK